MKRLKKFFFFLLAIIAFDYLKFLKNQSEYSAWGEMDPYMKRNYEGTDGEVGFVSGWDSDSANVGSGEQEIVAIEEGARIDYQLRFLKPEEQQANAYMTTSEIDESTTKVEWGFEGNIPYPFNVMILFMNLDEDLGPDLDKGLNNLKEILEKEAIE
jgi:hypothetical protein